MTKETIVFISRSSKYHREGKQLFHEEKVANFLVEKFKTIILSTSLKDNQKNTINYTNNNIEYIYLPNCKPEKFTYNFQKELKKYINILSSKNKKLVIFGNDFSLYPLSLSKNFEKIKFIHNIHSPPITSFEISENLFITIYNFIKNFRRLFKRIIKNNFSYRNIIKKKNHKIVFSSSNLKKVFFYFIFRNFKKKNQDLTHVIPLCMDVKYDINDQSKLKIDNLFYEFNKDGKPIIAYIGRMTSKKGIWKILQLSKYINKSNLDLKILIAGPCDGNYLKKITKFINKNKIHNIKLIPQGIKNEEVRYYYEKCDFAIHISNIFEGLSYSIHEAMLSKCIVISNYSNEIINKDNGLYYKKINYHKIIRDISRVIKNEDEYLKLKNNANLIIKNYYNNKIFVNKLMNLIKN